MLPDFGPMQCPNLAVSADVMHHVVHVESSSNPYAIGVVGGRLVRQPKSLAEALATVRMLESRGYNFSLGLAQVNRYNLKKYGIGSYEQAFQPCANVKAGSEILAECFRRSRNDWGKSFSCYYSGDFATGFRHGYVQKIYASIQGGSIVRKVAMDPLAIPLIERRVAAASKEGAYGETAVEMHSAFSPQAKQESAVQTPLDPPLSGVLVSQQAVSIGQTGRNSIAPMSPSIAGSEERKTTSYLTNGMPPALAGTVMLTPDGPVLPNDPPNAKLPSGAISPTAAVDAAFVF